MGFSSVVESKSEDLIDKTHTSRMSIKAVVYYSHSNLPRVPLGQIRAACVLRVNGTV